MLIQNNFYLGLRFTSGLVDWRDINKPCYVYTGLTPDLGRVELANIVTNCGLVLAVLSTAFGTIDVKAASLDMKWKPLPTIKKPLDIFERNNGLSIPSTYCFDDGSSLTYYSNRLPSGSFGTYLTYQRAPALS